MDTSFAGKSASKSTRKSVAKPVARVEAQADAQAIVSLGAVIAILKRVDEHGVPWLRLADRRMVAARCLTSVTAELLARAMTERLPVLIANEAGDPTRPIILGVVGVAALASPVVQPTAHMNQPPTVATVDGERVVITGRDEVVLRCGEASITLTKAGKILLAGAYISSRAAGVNRVRGGSVQIN